MAISPHEIDTAIRTIKENNNSLNVNQELLKVMTNIEKLLSDIKDDQKQYYEDIYSLLLYRL